MDTEHAPTLQLLRHELRTPVNHIIGYSEMLLEDESTAEADRNALNLAVQYGHAMLQAIQTGLNGSEHNGIQALQQLHQQVTPHIAATITTISVVRQQALLAGDAERAADLEKIVQAATRLDELTASLPRSIEVEAEYEPESPLTMIDGSESGHLLLVDDNELNREMLVRRLERLGYPVTTAGDGRQALDRLRSASFDLVLLDLMMPVMDGYAVLQEMRSDTELRRIPVIVLSALDDMASVVRAVELGADDYLPKPFDPVLLKARISACLFKKHLRDLEVAYLKRIEQERRRADDLLHVVIPIGVALSVEKDFNALLERIVVEAQNLCRADGGTLYLKTEDQRLRFVIVRNRTLNIAMGGASGKDIPFPPLRLYDEHSGAPLHTYVVTHVTLDGKTINIADAYHAEGFDFSGTRDFDHRTGYKTTSLLTLPLKDGLDRVIGVLQLLNAHNEAGEVIPFDEIAEQMLESLGALAAAALSAYAREQQLREEIADLQIEVDQARKEREVASITNTPFFQQIQEKSRQLRSANEAGAEATEQALPATRRSSGGPERAEVMVGDQRIVVRMQGNERRRLLLLLHGWSSSWYALSPLMTTLRDRYRCVAVDLPGYGDSPRLPNRTTIPDYADLLSNLIRQLSPEQPAVLIGHSMGGMISLTMALRHPELVERMVLLCPTISGNLSFWIKTFISPITLLERSRIAGRIVSGLEPYMMRVTDRLMRPASFAERTGINQADYERLRADARRPGQGRVRAECYSAMQANDLRGRLGAISIPSLVVWGMEDNTVPLRDASVVADEWPQAELRVIPKAGHWPQFETPDLTSRYVRGFLSTPLKLLRAGF
ncbi:MAG: alpha/beta fold hydrolase [Oscillochloris sp.]|nr:alpha/beta fold hydrolase [Oscillochloris sp.]